MQMGYRPTKKFTKEIVTNFVENKAQIFSISNVKRGTNAVEGKVIDALWHELSVDNFSDDDSYKSRVENLLVCVFKIADKVGFMKIIYDFVLMCNKNYY